MTRVDYEEQKGQRRTILSVFEPDPIKSVFATTPAAAHPIPRAEDVSVQIRCLEAPNEHIEYRLVPGDFALAMYNLKESPDSLAGQRAKFKQFIENARSGFDLIVLDCNPSSSFLTRAALESSTHLLTPVRPDRYSLLGVEMLQNFVSGLHSIATKPKMLLLLNGVASNATPSEETELRSHSEFGPLTLVSKVPHSDLLRARSDHAGFAVDRPVPHRNKLRTSLVAVANEIARKVGV